MFPSWSGRVLIRIVVLASLCVLILGGVYQVSGSLSRETDQALQTQPIKPSSNIADAADEAKPHKDGARARQTVPEGLKDSKPISLIEAISLVEKIGKGEVVKAEKVGEGTKAQFNLETIGKNKARLMFNLDAIGGVILETAVPTPKVAPKKKGKGG